MKRFTVVWSQEALDEIAQLWIAADGELRNAIMTAWHKVDEILANEPMNVGESREIGRRVMFEYPLAVKFKVEVSTSTTRLLQIWTFKKRKK